MKRSISINRLIVGALVISATLFISGQANAQVIGQSRGGEDTGFR